MTTQYHMEDIARGIIKLCDKTGRGRVKVRSQKALSRLVQLVASELWQVHRGGAAEAAEEAKPVTMADLRRVVDDAVAELGREIDLVGR